MRKSARLMKAVVTTTTMITSKEGNSDIFSDNNGKGAFLE